MGKILFLDNGVENDTYQAINYWEPVLYYPFDLFRVAADEWPADLASYTHVLITGSSASVLDDTAWMQREMELIQSAVDRGKVVLGSCFGHQIMARALFGVRAVRRREKPDVGWADIEIMVDDPLLGDGGRILNGYVFHYDEVCDVPQGMANIIARSAQCDTLAFKLIGKPVWGIQPHFEIGIIEGLKYFDIVSGEDIPTRQSFLGSDQQLPKDSGWIAPMMKSFHEMAPVS
jgi:GMP synthase-like glutamine amidotransferase